MKTVSLTGTSREITKKSVINALRRDGFVPCVIYGNNVKNIHFTLTERDLQQVLNTPNSYIIELNIDGATHKAIYHAAQFHPVTDEPIHIDFLAVSDKKPVVINIPISIVGNSEGVREGGKLILATRKVRVSANINKLPDSIEVDISKLKIGKSIYAEDINLEGVTLVTPKNTIICSVKMTRAAIGAAAAAAASGKK